MKNKLTYWLVFIGFIGITLFLTFNRHSKSGYFNYHSEIWADKAGYYVYLPATFKYGFNTAEFPDSMDVKTGNGFRLDLDQNKVLTKYTYVVAFLQMPFYLIADIFAKPLSYIADGFSPIYHYGINIAAIFYLALSLHFLREFLRKQYGNVFSSLTVIILFLATNLFYYSIDETGMSHVYSFFLFSFFLFFIQKTQFLANQKIFINFIFGVLCGFILLIRPSNLIFLGTFFFLDADGSKNIFLRIKRLFSFNVLLPVFAGVALVVLPQLVYWNYAFGSMFSYSYANEGFNWTDPKLLETFFSPNNGLFLYTPFYILIIAVVIYMLRKNTLNAVFLLTLFVLISYVFSSWWDWSFGCGFGARSYVEYLAVFSIPLAFIIRDIHQRSKSRQVVFWSLIIFFVFFNLKMTYSYDGCFYGLNNWDWQAYIELVKSSTK